MRTWRALIDSMVLSRNCQHDLDQAEILADAVASHSHRYPDMALAMARVYVKKGRYDDALRYIEVAAEHSDQRMAMVLAYDDFDPIRSHDRFVAASLSS